MRHDCALSARLRNRKIDIEVHFQRSFCLWKTCELLWRVPYIFDVISLAHLLAFRQNPPSRPFEELSPKGLDIALRAVRDLSEDREGADVGLQRRT